MSTLRVVFFTLFLSIIFQFTSSLFLLSVNDANGGDNCVICTLFTAIFAQLSQLYQITPLKAFELFCSFLTEDILHDACDAARFIYGPKIAHYLDMGYNPDETCFALGYCNDNDGPMCRLFPPYTSDQDVKSQAINSDYHYQSEPALCNITEFKPICAVLQRWDDVHHPVGDIDGEEKIVMLLDTTKNPFNNDITTIFGDQDGY